MGPITCLCVLFAAASLTSSYIVDPCPQGCRCTAGPKMHDRHRWHRLLAAYRTHRMVYGSNKMSSASGSYKTLDKPEGRQMTCVGLLNMPDHIPGDVSKITLFGETRGGSTQQQDSPADGSSGRGVPSSRYNQLTAIRRYAFRDTSAITELVVEGNRIKVMHANDLEMLTSLKTLRMRGNRMKVLWAGSLAGLSLLEDMDLSDNHLKRIPKTFFQDTPLLRKLQLHRNRIRGIHRKLFSSLGKLEQLDLSDNYLRDLPKDVFMGNANLRELNLDKNHLQVMRPDWFTEARHLTRLSLRENRIQELSASVLAPLGHLKYLMLDKNEVSELRYGSLSGTSAMHTLSLAHNNISVVEDYVFHEMAGLRELDLGGNHVKMLTNATFYGLDNLEGLVLANNELLDIQAYNFEMLKGLSRLDLSHNFIKTIKTRNFYGLLHLREMRLDHNDIRVIEEEGFAVSMVNTYSKLTWLYLHFNQLGAITERNLYGLSYVKFLNLCHNELSYIEPGGLAMMRRLHTLVLNNNQLTDLTPGTFKQVRHLQHLNLAANHIRHIRLNTLQGLDRLEDLNLEDNKLSELPVEVLTDVPYLTSLDLTRNKLRQVDFSLLETMPRLKYLDMSRNGIVKIRNPGSAEGKLFFLSLADNHLTTLTPETMNCMATGAALHLYGNPWSCDCSVRWLLERSWGSEIKLPDPDDIVCKTPDNVAGEQLLSLHPDDLWCGYQNEAAPEADEPAEIACGFLEHAVGETSRGHVKARKGDIAQWMVTLVGDQNAFFCKGVLVSRGWMMTSSNCWKQATLAKLWLVQGEDDEGRVPIEVDRIFHYPGSLDLALVSLQTKSSHAFADQRVYPCILSEDGWEYVQDISGNGILERTRHSPRSGVRLNGIPVKISGNASCPAGEVCFEGPSGRFKNTKSSNINLPFFVKVGRTKWALAGLTGALSGRNQGPVYPLYPATKWLQNTMDT